VRSDIGRLAGLGRAISLSPLRLLRS